MNVMKNSFSKLSFRFFLIINFFLILFIIHAHYNFPTVLNQEQFFKRPRLIRPIHSSKKDKLVRCAQLCPYVGNFTRNYLEFDSTHFVRHYPEFICPSNFRNIADWVYGSFDHHNQKIESTTKSGQTIAPCLPDGSIIYVKLPYLDEFFSKAYPHLINNFVLITGEGDSSSPNDLIHLEHPKSKIIHWFGQNGQIDASKSNKFTHIPIGINCHEMAQAIQGVHAQKSNNTLPPIHGDIDEPSRYIQPIDLTRRALDDNANVDAKKLLLINFDWHTDQTRVRERVWKTMCLPKNTPPFITCAKKRGGVNIRSLADIYARNRKYSFWLSPRGGGIDSHRTWEALYLDVIPIVWNSTLNILYENLPVVVIQNYKEITETLLRQKLREISMKKYNQMTTAYRFEKLRNAYWRRLILSKSRHSLVGSNIRTGLCWRAKINNTNIRL